MSDPDPHRAIVDDAVRELSILTECTCKAGPMPAVFCTTYWREDVDTLAAEIDNLRKVAAARELHAAYDWPQRPPDERDAAWDRLTEALGIDREKP